MSEQTDDQSDVIAVRIDLDIADLVRDHAVFHRHHRGKIRSPGGIHINKTVRIIERGQR